MLVERGISSAILCRFSAKIPRKARGTQMTRITRIWLRRFVNCADFYLIDNLLDMKLFNMVIRKLPYCLFLSIPQGLSLGRKWHHRRDLQAVGLQPKHQLGRKPTACKFVCASVFYRAVIPTGFYKKQKIRAKSALSASSAFLYRTFFLTFTLKML